MGFKHFQRSKHLKRTLAVFAFAILSAAGLMAFRYSEEAEDFLPIAPAENQELLFFGQEDSRAYLMLREDEAVRIFCLDLNSGESTMAELKKEPAEVAVCNDSLRIFSTDSMTASVLFWNPEIEISDAQKDAYQYFADISKATYMAVSGESLYITSPEGELWGYAPFEFDSDKPVMSQVEFLDSMSEDRLCAYSEGSMYIWAGGSFESRVQRPCGFIPTQVIGENGFAAENGVVYVLCEDEFIPLPDSLIQGEPFLEYISHDEVFTTDLDRTIFRHNFAGETTGSFSLEGKVKALASDGALIVRGNEYGFVPYRFIDIGTEPEETPTPEPEVTPEPELTPEPEPTPGPSSEPEPSEEPTPSLEPTPSSDPEPSQEPTPEPSQEPESSPTPDIATPTPTPTPSPKPFYSIRNVDGTDYILLGSPMRVEELRELKKPEAVKIEDQEGNPVSAGLLKTGMKMNDTYIVIQGDCTGDGYINVKDMELGCYCILGERYIQTDAAFLAIDYDDDGQLSLLDLVSLSDAIAANQ